MAPPHPPTPAPPGTGRRPAAAGTPSLLPRFLAATDEATRSRVLGALVEEEAMPIIRRVLARKFGPATGEQADAEETISAARERLIERLLELHADQPSFGLPPAPAEGSAPAAGPPIRDFAAYTAAVAYSEWSRHLSRRYPQRAILANSLRHLLDDRRAVHGLALWPGADGERLCGLAPWKGAPPAPAAPEPARCLHLLAADPPAAAREALPPGTDPCTCHLPDLLAALFRWTGAPVEWHDLLAAVTRLRDAEGPAEVSGEHAELSAALSPDPTPGPHNALRWREYLAWLWRSVGALSLRQRRAFLLHSHVVFDWEAAGTASLRELAALVELPAERLAELWGRLPLDDHSIAALLPATRQQVINLRRVARDTLGRRWREWLADEGSAAR